MSNEQYVFGDYVITPCKNAFNNKTSYWISKKGYMLSVYCFTPLNERDLQFHINEIKQYTDLFDRMIERI